MIQPKYYLTIHGHFYQPPRENPWIEEIELQKSAYPFHDWNERILSECYAPNAIARILDEKGNIVDVVNNFEKINFNVGPTLMSWLEAKHPNTYHKIIEADRVSVQSTQGVGNAIAQVYNHMIMPLASRRDKVTQVKWGIADFKKRFSREPEAMWLPETACDEESIDVLIEFGFRYVILDQNQAKAIRSLDAKEWQDVSGGKIDPKRPYRYFSPTSPKKFIDVFFYDGSISKGVGFGDLLSDAKHFMNRIEGAKVEAAGIQLIHAATDGETFGHHKIFGDRAIAYLLNIETEKRDFHVTSYSRFLQLLLPKEAVDLNFGESFEGTSWSCLHGIKRWKEHCGCRGEGPAEWTQHWRKPLRESLDWLQGELTVIFESRGGTYLKDVWQARGDYINVILERSDKAVWQFFEKHANHVLSPIEVTACLKLLEMERHAMLMYTSCGWFFTEISGIETVQILQYAARAIELAGEFEKRSLEEGFLERLAKAKSNVPFFKDGRGVYEKLVKPARVTLPHVAGFYGIHSILKPYKNRENIEFYCFHLQVKHQRVETHGNFTLNFGSVVVVSKIARESLHLAFAVLQTGPYDFRCSTKPISEFNNFDLFEKELFEKLSSGSLDETIRKIDSHFGQTHSTLKEVPLEWRIKIISMLTKESIEKINQAYERLYEENRKMNEIYRSINLPIPDEIRYAVDYTLNRQFVKAIAELADQHFDPRKAARAQKILETAEELDLELKRSDTSALLSNALAQRVRNLSEQVTEETVSECLNIERLAKKLEISLDERAAQDYLFGLFKRWKRDPSEMQALSLEVVNNIFKFAAQIHINPREVKKEYQKLSPSLPAE